MTQNSRLFRCPKCGWWAIGAYQPDETAGPEKEKEDDDVQFDVKCTSEDCGWTGQLVGGQSYKIPLKTKSP